MTHIIPVFRIFDYSKAIEFYVNWLGFTINWKHFFDDNSPIYLEIELNEVLLHLSEHHGDGTPGSRVFVRNFKNLREFHQEISEKNYKFNRPRLETFHFDKTQWCVELTDPFANKLIFTGAKS